MTCSTHGGGSGVYRVLVGRPEGKRVLGRPKCSWKNNFKMGFRDIGIYVANWIRLAQDGVRGRLLWTRVSQRK